MGTALRMHMQILSLQFWKTRTRIIFLENAFVLALKLNVIKNIIKHIYLQRYHQFKTLDTTVKMLLFFNAT